MSPPEIVKKIAIIATVKQGVNQGVSVTAECRKNQYLCGLARFFSLRIPPSPLQQERGASGTLFLLQKFRGEIFYYIAVSLLDIRLVEDGVLALIIACIGIVVFSVYAVLNDCLIKSFGFRFISSQKKRHRTPISCDELFYFQGRQVHIT